MAVGWGDLPRQSVVPPPSLQKNNIRKLKIQSQFLIYLFFARGRKKCRFLLCVVINLNSDDLYSFFGLTLQAS